VAASDGALIELRPGVIAFGHLKFYRDVEYVCVHVDATPEQRVRVVRAAAELTGKAYGRWNMLACALATVTRGTMFGRIWPRQNCASVVAFALTQAGIAMPEIRYDIAPVDLAAHFGVRG